jgi:serine/threonine protein kinase
METQKDQARSSNLYDQLIDQYKLEAHINQTAVTDLYRAFDVDENRRVAVEILLPIFNNKKQYVDQFIDKMNKVSQIKHPNIAQVHQIGVTPNNRPYIARDFVEGITLRARLNQIAQQKSDVNSIYALKIVRQLAEALELAERLDIYHYDLSPDIIQIKQDGTVVLVDLGIPALDNGFAPKATTPSDSAYTAPECLQGRPVDSRAQIYALGAILHEILTGKVPSEPVTTWQSITQAIQPKNSSLIESRPDLAQQTYELVAKSLRKQPWGRHRSIKEFLDAVEEALQNERLLVQTRSGGDTAVLLPAKPRRSRIILLLPLVAILFILGGIALWAPNWNQANSTPASQSVAINTEATTPTRPTPTVMIPPTNIESNSDSAISAYPIDSTVSVGTISLLAPADATEFQAGDATSFRWSWSNSLQENQRFSVYLLTDNGRSLLGSVSTPTLDGNYSLQTLLPDSSSNGMTEWQIVLEDLVTNRDIATSSNRRIAIKPAPLTATFTPTPTETATATFTPSPTPIPQVEIFVSSASLRQGPGTIYPILRYLYEGEVVGVIGQDSPAGEWYNVILDDGSRGWLAAIACRWVDDSSKNNIPIAATIPVRPTNTPTSTPTNTPTPTFTPTPNPGGGNPPPPPANTPTPTAPPLPTP